VTGNRKIMNTFTRPLCSLAVALSCVLSAPSAIAQQPATDSQPEPETIYSVSHVIAGKEAAFDKARIEAWAIYQRLGLVLPKPHVVLRGTDEGGKTYFVEIFTWKDAAIPDHAPPEVRAVWKQLEAACEPRGGRPGIDFSDGGVTLLDQ
jgi:hypothetical protein